MSLMTLCQRCGKAYDNWLVRQAALNVGKIADWKLQLCTQCTDDVEKALRGALQPPTWQEKG